MSIRDHTGDGRFGAPGVAVAAAADGSFGSAPSPSVLPDDATAGRSAEGCGPPRRAQGTVLVVASRFPPVASVGAIRVRKFVKYLGRFGWRCVVLTGAQRRPQQGRHDVGRAVDLDSLQDLPAGLPVVRLPAVLDCWPVHVARRLATVLAPCTRGVGWDERWWSAALRWRFQHWHDRLAFPDRGIWKLPSAVRVGVALHRRHRFDAIFSTGMPFSDHVTALALQALIRRPWLADFRDPWAEYAHWQQWNGKWGRRLTHAAERAVIRRAARVISVNDRMTQRFRERYQDAPTGRFVTIANGFDPPDFDCQTPRAARTQFCLLYAGSLYQTRDPARLLEAFHRFVQAVPGAREHVRFDFAGRPGRFVEALTQSHCDGVSYLGLLSHAETTRRMAAADVNVVLLPNVPGGEVDSTAKIYECLGSGRPVLAAVPLSGAAATELRRYDGVWLCDPDDVDAITQSLVDLYRRWLMGALIVRRAPAAMRSITRERQTAQLAACLDRVVIERRGRQAAGAHGFRCEPGVGGRRTGDS